LEKYDAVISAKGLERFNKGDNPYQNAALLIKLRNELVHFHPEWHNQQKRHAKLGKDLRGRFDFSPFIAEENGVDFPQRFVGHGCTQWAVSSALTFMESFASRIGYKNKFEKFHDRLSG